MRSEAEKAATEREVFAHFLRMSSVCSPDSGIESRPFPQPDILCTPHSSSPVAFELSELCDEQMAEAISIAREDAFWTADPSARILNQKLCKNYASEYSVNLLLYTAGRIVTPDNVIIPTLEYEIGKIERCIFDTIWFMSNDIVQKLYRSTLPV